MNRKRSSDKHIKAITAALIFLVILSKYHSPTRELVEGLENWLVSLREEVTEYSRWVIAI